MIRDHLGRFTGRILQNVIRFVNKNTSNVKSKLRQVPMQTWQKVCIYFFLSELKYGAHSLKCVTHYMFIYGLFFE